MREIEQAALAALRADFSRAFGAAPQHILQAPGRVNLIGEHTDYNDGFVLPCAIDYRTLVAARARKDDTVRVVAADYAGERDEFSLGEAISPHASQTWCNYIRGVLRQLLARGLRPGGADLLVTGDVPQGAGLSSSASLEVAVGEAFRHLYQLPIDDVGLALVGQEAENQFVGCNCGIMDQMISVRGARGHAMLLDCRSLQADLIPMPSGLAVTIVNSNVQRGLLDSEYNNRRERCEEAATTLGIKALRDITLGEFVQRERELSAIAFRRARHVVSENERTRQAAVALRDADVTTLSRLMAESHASMRDDFEITVEPIDFIVSTLAEYLGDHGGARMTGGGFGGCVVTLMPHDRVDGARKLLARTYQARYGARESVYVCSAAEGSGIV